jgi:hypothetical protein
MICRTRNHRPAAEPVVQDAASAGPAPVAGPPGEDHWEDVPLGDDAAPEVIMALAAVMRSEADGLGDAAASARSAATQLVDEARARAAEIVAAAEGKARDLDQDGRRLDERSTAVAERARWLANAASQQEQADEAEDRAEDLEDERDRLIEKIAQLEVAIAGSQGDRAAADQNRAAAASSRDRTAIAAALQQLAVIDEELAAAEAELSTARARLAAIGDGVGPGELATARQTSGAHRGAVRRILNEVWPGRLEALRDDALRTAQACLDRLAEEGRAEPERPRQFVHLG